MSLQTRDDYVQGIYFLRDEAKYKKLPHYSKTVNLWVHDVSRNVKNYIQKDKLARDTNMKQELLMRLRSK